MIRSFRNLAIAPKIFSAIALLVMTMLTVGGLALYEFNAMNNAIIKIEEASVRVFGAGRATANLMAYARNVEFLPIEMPLSDREAFEKGAVDEHRRLMNRVDQLQRAALGETGRAEMDKIRQLVAVYEAEHQKIKTIARSGDYDTSGKLAYTVAPAIEQVRAVFRSYEQRNEARMADGRRAAAESYAQARLSMLIALVFAVLSIGLVAYIVLSFVTRPLQAMTGAMLKVAGGDTDVAVPSLGQADEIGKLAGALETFKENLVENRRNAAEQERERATKERRANVVASAVAEFERSVGEVISTVTSASTELEGAANTLTQTADNTQQMAGFVASASEEASSNVQSVAAATDEMTSSVDEIGRQVQASSHKAQDAVRPGPGNRCAGDRAARCRRPHWRGGQADHGGCRADQPFGAQRHDRGGARRRSRQGLRGGGIRGQAARRPDRQGDGSDHRADQLDAGRDARGSRLDQGDRPDHRGSVGYRHRNRGGGRGAGRCDPGDRPQCPGGRQGHGGGRVQHHGGQPRRGRYRLGFGAGAVGGSGTLLAGQPAQVAGRCLPGDGAGRLTQPLHSNAARRPPQGGLFASAVATAKETADDGGLSYVMNQAEGSPVGHGLASSSGTSIPLRQVP